ncbi:MAG TPA: hypothetical protein VLU46_09300 [Thermoanaerobaculia bacterium]|nr:hypothetical protein [Thermoanaerobaculia bacterium]
MRKLFVILCTFVAAAVSAAQFRDFYVIPVAAHAPGANNTDWRTDVAIQNIQSTPVAIEMALVESGEALSDNIQPVGTTVTVAAGQTVILRDVLNNYRGRASASGALLVGGDKAFAITSRTYNQTPAGTLGQTVAAFGDVATDGSDDGSTLFIPGLVQNSAFRTNLGLLMSATSKPMTVSVMVNGATRMFTVQPGVTTHIQFPVTSVATAPFDAAGAVVKIVDGSGTVIGYASVVDNGTGDASFISGGTAAAGSVQSLRLLLATR